MFAVGIDATITTCYTVNICLQSFLLFREPQPNASVEPKLSEIYTDVPQLFLESNLSQFTVTRG